MVEYGHKIEEEVKAMQNEKKENVQGTNSDEKEQGHLLSTLPAFIHFLHYLQSNWALLVLIPE